MYLSLIGAASTDSIEVLKLKQDCRYLSADNKIKNYMINFRFDCPEEPKVWENKTGINFIIHGKLSLIRSYAMYGSDMVLIQRILIGFDAIPTENPYS